MASRTMAMRLPLARSAASLRVAAPRALSRNIMTASTSAVAARRTTLAPRMSFVQQQQRGYAGPAPGELSQEEIKKRVFEVLNSFEKVNPSKISDSANFVNDLGLDSLDVVEVVMAIEEEFSIEMSDSDADAIHTVQQAIDYVARTPHAY